MRNTMAKKTTHSKTPKPIRVPAKKPTDSLIDLDVPTISELKKESREQGLLFRMRLAWQLLLKKYVLSICGALTDFLYVFLFAGLTTWAFLSIEGPIQRVYAIAGDNISALSMDLTNQEALKSIMASQQEFIAAYTEVIKVALLFMAGVLVLWLILQGLAWAISHAIGAQKILIGKYIRRFLIVSVCGWILIIGLLYVSMKVSAWININRLGEWTQATASAIVIILFFTILYFLFSGYATPTQAGKGMAWKVPTAGWKTMLPAYIISLAIAFIGYWIFQALVTRWFYAGVTFGIIVVAPLYTYNRILMVLSACEAIKRI